MLYCLLPWINDNGGVNTEGGDSHMMFPYIVGPVVQIETLRLYILYKMALNCGIHVLDESLFVSYVNFTRGVKKIKPFSLRTCVEEETRVKKRRHEPGG